VYSNIEFVFKKLQLFHWGSLPNVRHNGLQKIMYKNQLQHILMKELIFKYNYVVIIMYNYKYIVCCVDDDEYIAYLNVHSV
jgi:hypothetical protein